MHGEFITFTGPQTAEIISRAVEELKPREILIEAEVSLISAGTERLMFKAPPVTPYFPGYSMVGRVAKIGSGVTRFAVGDRVAASAPHGSHVKCEDIMAFRIPASVASEHATFITVGAMALYAVRMADIRLGDAMLIIGQGLIGLLASQIARVAGALPVIGTDMQPARLELARKLGADHAFQADDADGLRRVLAGLPGGGVAATIDLSGAPNALNLGVGATRRRGRVIAAALNPDGGQVAVYGEAFLKGVALVGAYFNARPWRLDSSDLTLPTDWPPRMLDAVEFEGLDIATSAGDTAMILRLIEHGRLNVAPLITDTVSFRDAPALFDKLAGTGFLGGIIRW